MSVRFFPAGNEKAPELAAVNHGSGKLRGLALCGAGLSTKSYRLPFRATLVRSRTAVRRGST